MVLDELKLYSDDAMYNEEHIMFLLSKYRAFLLKQRYSDIKKHIPESNYQTLCLDLEVIDAISGKPCMNDTYLRSKEKIPFLMQIGTPRVYPTDYYQGDIAYVSRDRMRYTGYNRYLKNIIYCSLGPDNYLYFKSSNPQFLHMEKVRFTGIFQDAEEASSLQCSNDGTDNECDVMDKVFPIEEALVPPMIELVVKELSGAIYRPNDDNNNAKDDMADVQVKK